MLLKKATPAEQQFCSYLAGRGVAFRQQASAQAAGVSIAPLG